MDITEIRKKIQQQKQDFTCKNAGIKRPAFTSAIQALDLPNALLITGLRRVGKTTLMRQIYDHLLNQSVPDHLIHFFSFDEHQTRNLAFLTQLLETWLPNHPDRPTYIFLDEIQYITNWQGTLKRYLDFFPNVKFILSGSASLFIKHKSNESLAGRTWELKLNPLSFHEYQTLFLNRKLSGFELEKLLVSPSDQNFRSLTKLWDDRIPAWITEFADYQRVGQFPEARVYHSLEQQYKYINQGIYQKLIQIDLPTIFPTENISQFSQLYQIAVQDTGNYLSISNLAAEIGLSPNTLKRYLDIFQQAWLLDRITTFTKSLRKRTRAKEKLYIASSNFYAARNQLQPEFKENSVLGHLLETTVFNTLNQLFDYRFFYYRQQQEVDFLVTRDPTLKNLIPVEVKYKTKIWPEDIKNLIRYMDRKNISHGFVIALSAEKRIINNKTIWIIPAPLVL